MESEQALAKAEATWRAAGAKPSQLDAIAALRDFGAALLQTTTLNEVLVAAERHIGAVLPHTGGFILLRPQPTYDVQQHMFAPLTLPRIDDERLQVSGGLAASVLADGQPRIAHGGDTARLAFWERQIVADGQPLLCAPLLIAQHCDGVVGLRGAVGARFGDDEAALLMALAAPLSLAFERAQQHIAATRVAQATKIAGMRRLTSAIGHELRNPLQGLQSSLHLLLSPTIAVPKRDLVLQKAQEETEQLITTVQRMLACYSPAYEDMRPIAVPVLIERVLALAAPEISARHISVQRDWSGKLPYVRGVEGHLKQALLSLVQNAIESMPNSGLLSIHIRADERLNDNTKIVQIDISDSGPGIPADQLATIFEPFYSTKTNQIGLGLAISYGIIDHHTGVLNVSSGNTGTTFSVLLPAF